MVNVGEQSNRNGLQGFYVNGDTSATGDSDDLRLDDTALMVVEHRGFQPIYTPCATVLAILILALLETLVFTLPYLVDLPNDSTTSVYSIILYCHAATWLFMLLADAYLGQQHRVSRRNGYLEFYRRTKLIRRAPLVFCSAANVLLLVVVVFLADYCRLDDRCAGTLFTRTNYLQIIISLETVCVCACLFVYLVQTIKFNSEKACPDVQQEELLSHYMQSHVNSSEIGFRDDNQLDDVLEKQADMIRYLQQHNANLGKRIIKLQAQLQAPKA
ncbi:PREDICTED: transmembrane protein 192-like [Priapulus caudatus]|uniref:Transmembrane protein 192 n=1 Tax=Priapulus caudatus TaxID=37621 RepID=A0ABM1F0C4_PRICU|nr:PREDICTED: transmembrane protein 192-like [Priapulus caudatus]